jgi:hypothetical protein
LCSVVVLLHHNVQSTVLIVQVTGVTSFTPPSNLRHPVFTHR